MIKTDLIMLSTGKEAILLEGLIESIEGNTEGLGVHLLLVNQGPQRNWTSQDPKLSIESIEVGQQMSLSAARNLGLKHLSQKNIEAKYLLFPDDDSTFKADFFQAIKPHLDLPKPLLAKICNVEDGGDYRSYPKIEKCGKTELKGIVASVSLIIPFALIAEIGPFDEKLGVGAKWGSSEDLDYYLRACQLEEFCFLPELKNYHPSRFGKYEQLGQPQIKKRFASYTDGYLAVHFRHRLEHQLGLFASKALGGALLSILKLNFNLASVYLWLYFYRIKQKAYFRSLRKNNPEALAL